MKREDIVLAVSKKKLDTNDKYLQKLDDIKIRVPGGYKKVIQDFASLYGYKSVNQLVIALINEKMEEKGYLDRIPTGLRETRENQNDQTE